MESTTLTEPTTTTDLPRFGKLTYAPADVIEFPWGIPGYSDLHRWLFLSLDSQSGFVWLQSLDDPTVALPAANPWMVFEKYDPKLPFYAFAALEIASAEDFTLLCVTVCTEGAREMTINLAAPIVVNLAKRKACQIQLEGSSYSARESIPRKESQTEALLSAKAS
jgi:flagellar assembly factor FliW